MLMQAYNTCMYVSAVSQESQKDPVSLEAPHTVEPCLMTTRIFNGHIILAQGNTQSVTVSFKEPL